MRSSELADHIAWRTTLIKPALDWIVAEAFPFRSGREELFELECTDDKLRTLATRLVFSKHSDSVYGYQTYDLSEFFRQHLRSLFTRGQSFARIYWTSEEKQRGMDEDRADGVASNQSPDQRNGPQGSADATDTVHHFTGLRSDGIRVRGSSDRPDGYEVDPARAHWWGRPSEWKGKPRYRLQPDKMIAFRWPFATTGRNTAPVLAVVPEYWEMTIWMRSSLSSTYAATSSKVKGLRAEAARYRDIASGLERQVWADTRAFRKIGGSLLHSHAIERLA